MTRPILKPGLLAGAALALVLSVPALPGAYAQPEPTEPSPDLLPAEPGDTTPETLGAGRIMEGPAGDALTTPAPPLAEEVEGGIEPDTENRERAATGAETLVGDDEKIREDLVEEDEGAGVFADPYVEPGEPTVVDEDVAVMPEGANSPTRVDPAERNIEQAETILNTVGGGALAENQIYPEDMVGFGVTTADGEQIGEVAGTVLNYETGEITRLIISRGGFLGTDFADKLYDVPWSRISGVDKRAEEVMVDLDADDLRPSEVFEEQADLE